MFHSRSLIYRRCFPAALAIALLIACPRHAGAATKTWQGGTSTWDNAAAWSPTPGKPQPGDYAHIWQAGASVTYQNPAVPSGLIEELSIDATGAGASFTQAQDQLTTTSTRVGEGAKGVFIQSGGLHIVTGPSGLQMGYSAAADGSYTLSGNATLTANDSTYVGAAGKGAFTQTGGVATFGTDPTPNSHGLYLAYDAGSSGTYTFSAGSLSAGFLQAGLYGAGQFKQSGGTATINGTVSVSAKTGATSEYQLSGNGVLADQNVLIGAYGGTAKFTQAGGTHTIAQTMLLGSQSSGSYSLQAGTLNSYNIYVGYYGGIPGSFVQSGGIHNAAAQIRIGNSTDAPGTSTYTLSGGTLNHAGGLTVDSSGAYLQTGGTLTTEYLTLYPHGSLKISGGTVDVTNGTLQIDDVNTSKADITNCSLFLNYTGGTSVATMRNYIAHAYNGGAWNGNGLTSSTAAANPAGAIGYGEAKDVLGLSGNATANWQGHNADASSILVRYTLFGDADLDGDVDFNDLVKVAQNYNTSNGYMLWTQGDFNYDGNVDFNDLVKIAQNYSQVLPGEPIAGAPDDFQVQLAAAYAAVPEPSMCAFAALVAIAWACRRRSTWTC